MEGLAGSDLLTVAGAGVAAGVIVQAIKFIWDGLAARWYRLAALTTGLVVVQAAYWTIGDTDPSVVGVILAVIVGLQAGASAITTYDTVRTGWDYDVTPPA